MSKEDLDIENAELLEKLDLIVDGKLKRAGALCFYRKPEKVIGGCYVKIGKFEGSELLYRDEVHGSLLILADRVIGLIMFRYRYALKMTPCMLVIVACCPLAGQLKHF